LEPVKRVLTHERQYAKSFDKVKVDHRARYEFAKSRVRGKILDAACGTGYGSQHIGATIGIHIDPTAIYMAQTYFPGPIYIQSDIQFMSFTNLDWIVSFETIEHLPNPYNFLFYANAQYLICSAPNEEKIRFRGQDFVGDDYPHLRHYTPKEFDEFLVNCGWEPIERYSQKPIAVEPGTDGRYLVYVCKRIPER